MQDKPITISISIKPREPGPITKDEVNQLIDFFMSLKEVDDEIKSREAWEKTSGQSIKECLLKKE